MNDTIADKARKVMQQESSIGAVTFSVSAIAGHIGSESSSDAEAIRSALRDMLRRGEVERVSTGRYRYAGKKREKPEIREVMWHFLRSRRQSGNRITVADLVEVCGASARYATEWLQMLARRGVLKRISAAGAEGVYQMVSDPVEMPVDEPKHERLRLSYANKKIAIAALDTAYKAIIEARIAIASIPEKE